MFDSLRSFAPAVLLLTSLSGYAATGAVHVHVAREHGAAVDHHVHHDDHGDDRGDAATDHSHELTPATPASPARITDPFPVGPAHALAVARALLDPASDSSARLEVRGIARAGPLPPQRNPILLV
jgi:hypothetical protein